MNYAAGGRLEIRITPSDVGKRVSVRAVAELVDGRPVFRDAVGVLTSWADGVVIVTRRTGEVVRIPDESVVAGKVVPDAPARRRMAAPAATADELQRTASDGWPARETEVLGGWTLRAAGGFTRRANSVLALGDPGLPAQRAVERVRAWYAERGLPAYAQTLPGSAGARAFAAAGWSPRARSLLLTAPLPPLADLPGAERVTLAREVDADWLAAYGRTGERADAARAVLGGGASVWFASARSGGGGAVSAIGRCVVDGRWALFGAVEVEPSARRRGLAVAVVAALAAKALEEGASGAYLQVEADNDAARALWDRLGFTTHHEYLYYRCPEPAESSEPTESSAAEEG
ncbi:GNAT family N-acetyltransferase [Streptomyces sp. PTM05]|uniref:GNAT family N-acetyltransferase n=1 Tax=Streptantibioticus parmotrematis TaxID=2873249 RepID=A0ABS7QQN5_9ACTN|nr:GNAT family N-acetyltransferase [Streptantibioticus parmotrematis]MBY8884162.1 GNAT family N-acetyltransferase [Streptantibioticus parmotrematis]